MHLQEMKDMAERKIREWDADMGRPVGYLEARHKLVLQWGDDNAASRPAWSRTASFTGKPWSSLPGY